MHNEQEIWKMTSDWNDITRKFNDDTNQNRQKYVHGLYLSNAMLKLDGATNAFYYAGNIDPTYFGMPQ